MKHSVAQIRPDQYWELLEINPYEIEIYRTQMEKTKLIWDFHKFSVSGGGGGVRPS